MCKSAYGLCKGAKVKGTYRVAGGSSGWQVAGAYSQTLMLSIGRVGPRHDIAASGRG